MIGLSFTSSLTTWTDVPQDVLQSAAPIAAQKLRSLIALQFATTGLTGGTPWAPLRSGQPATLIRTGALRSSLLDPTDPNAVDEPGPTPGSWRIGSQLDYAAYLQAGTARMPPRQIITDLMRSLSTGPGEPIQGRLGNLEL